MHGGAMGEETMAEDDTDVTGDAPVGLGADAPAADAPAAEDPIDQLLREFEEGTQGNNQPAAQLTDQGRLERDRAFAANLNAHTEGLQIDARRAELQTAAQALQAEYDQRDTAAAITEIRGDLDSRYFDDQFVQSWALSQAMANPRLNEIWNSRAENPRAFQAAISKLSAEFSQKYSRLPDPVATEDHEAVAQAVRGSGEAPPERPPDLSKMSNRELQKYTQDNWGFS